MTRRKIDEFVLIKKDCKFARFVRTQILYELFVCTNLTALPESAAVQRDIFRVAVVSTIPVNTRMDNLLIDEQKCLVLLPLSRSINHDIDGLEHPHYT